MKKLLTEVPIIAAQNTIEIDISPATRAYSIAVAPERSARSAIGAEHIGSIITAIPGGMKPLLEGKTASGSSEGRCPNAARLSTNQPGLSSVRSAYLKC